MPKKLSRIASRGSVLIFSLIVLSFLLIASLSLASLALVDQRTASSTDRSSLSFQAADSAAELMLEKIYKKTPPYDSLRELCEAIDGDSNSSTGDCSCRDDTDVVLKGAINNSEYRVSFYDNDREPLTSCDSSDWRAEAVFMKSEGIYGNTNRAVQVVIRAEDAP